MVTKYQYLPNAISRIFLKQHIAFPFPVLSMNFSSKRTMPIDLISNSIQRCTLLNKRKEKKSKMKAMMRPRIQQVQQLLRDKKNRRRMTRSRRKMMRNQTQKFPTLLKGSISLFHTLKRVWVSSLM